MIQASIKVHKYQTKNLVEKIFFNFETFFYFIEYILVGQGKCLTLIVSTTSIMNSEVGKTILNVLVLLSV